MMPIPRPRLRTEDDLGDGLLNPQVRIANMRYAPPIDRVSFNPDRTENERVKHRKTGDQR
jgi:hypothetical protein